MGETGSGVRRQLIAGAADLIGRRGLRAATVRDLAEHSQTPEGSVYHYFPGGKQQLAAAAVRFNGERLHQLVAEGLQDGPIAGLRTLIAAVRELMASTRFRGGCPVLAVAVEGPDGDESSPALAAAAEVFDRWERLFTRSVEQHGVAEDQARRIGTLVFASLEGAVAMCRAKRSTQPIEHVAQDLEKFLEAILAGKLGDERSRLA